MKAQFKELGGWFANNAYSAVDTTGTQRKYKKKLKKVKDLTSVNKAIKVTGLKGRPDYSQLSHIHDQVMTKFPNRYNSQHEIARASGVSPSALTSALNVAGRKSRNTVGQKPRMTVSKMSPDQADLHVMGSGASKTKRRGKLKKYPEATRRI